VVDLVHAHGATELVTSCVPGEEGPAGFYAGLGFVPRGDVEPDGEIIMRLDLRE
jgi:diamine N-acetyltransferase